MRSQFDNRRHPKRLDLTMADMAKLAELAEQTMVAQDKVVLAEDDLKKAKAEVVRLTEAVLPELMDELALAQITTSGGLVLEVKENIRANITKPNEPKAFAWLRKNGSEKLIKGKLIVTPSDDSESAALQKKLQKYAVETKAGVHAGTLSSWAKEMLEEGKKFPEKLFGVYRQRVCKVTVKK